MVGFPDRSDRRSPLIWPAPAAQPRAAFRGAAVDEPHSELQHARRRGDGGQRGRAHISHFSEIESLRSEGYAPYTLVGLVHAT